MKQLPVTHPRGFTLVELVVVIALTTIVVSLVAPSFKRLIESQRVRSTNAQLVTDLQFARSEAVSRNTFVRMTWRADATQTCYSIYTYTVPATFCDCLLATPCAAGLTEIKTVRLPLSNGVKVFPILAGGQPVEFAFEPLTGSLYEVPTDNDPVGFLNFNIRTWIDAQRDLRTTVGKSGRPTVCAPTASKIQEAAC